MQRLADELLVDGQGNGFAHVDIVEWLFGGVKGQPVDGANTVKTLVRQVERRVGGYTLEFGGVGGVGNHLNLAALQAHEQAVGVGVDVDNDLVQVGLARQKELVKALKHQALAGLELGQAKRARAHHVGAVARVHFEVGAVAVNVLGQNRAQRGRHGQHDGWVRRAHADDGGVGVRRFHLVHGAHHGGERVVGLDGHDRKRHVGGCDRFAVMEHRVLAQVQGERLAVGGQRPFLSQVGLGVPLVVKTQRAGKNLAAGHRRGNARLHRAVHMAQSLRRTDDQGAAACGRVGGGQRVRGRQARQQGQGQRIAARKVQEVHSAALLKVEWKSDTNHERQRAAHQNLQEVLTARPASSTTCTKRTGQSGETAQKPARAPR